MSCGASSSDRDLPSFIFGIYKFQCCLRLWSLEEEFILDTYPKKGIPHLSQNKDIFLREVACVDFDYNVNP